MDQAERAWLFCVRAFAHLGYGRLMQIISHEWYRSDPHGAALANTAYGLLDSADRAAYEDIAKNDSLFTLEDDSHDQ